MATLSKLQPDQILYDVKRTKLGKSALYELKVLEVDLDKRRVKASWNGNPPRYFYERHINQWQVIKPQPKTSSWGQPSH